MIIPLFYCSRRKKLMEANRQKLTQNIKNQYYSVYIHLNLDNNKRTNYIGTLTTEKKCIFAK